MLVHHVARADEIDVVAGPAAQRVRTCATRDDVVQRVAVAGEITGADECQVFNVRVQRVGVQRGPDRIDPFPSLLDNPGVRTVDIIEVIAIAADQGVCPCSAGENVIARAAGDYVVKLVAAAGEVAGANKGEILTFAPSV